MKKADNEKPDSGLTDIEKVVRLLMLQLFRSGATQAEVAHALGVTQPTVSRMFPKGPQKQAKKAVPVKVVEPEGGN